MLEGHPGFPAEGEVEGLEGIKDWGGSVEILGVGGGWGSLTIGGIGGDVPGRNISIEQRVSEHLVDILDLGNVPLGNILVESGVVEHSMHIGGPGDVPGGNILVEFSCVFEDWGGVSGEFERGVI